MLEKLKLLYPHMDEELLSLLLDNAYSFVTDYCNLQTVPSALEGTVFAIVQEDITHLHANGLSSESTAGNSLSYLEDYSPAIYKRLNRFKKIKVVGE